MERRIITTEATEEDVRIETTLRPQCLEDYIGQPNPEGKRWIMCCFTAPLALERPPFPGLLQMRWERR